jgi:transcriptional regulator
MPEEEQAGPERDARILALRDAGASWQELARMFGLTRQQARYCYQRGKREERRRKRATDSDLSSD